MKSSLTLFLIITILTIVNVTLKKKGKHLKKNKNTDTPKGFQLKNHFGAANVGSPYGPTTDPYAQYVEANPETFMPFKTDGKKKILQQLEFKPYPGHETKLNPNVIKSGDMTNIAPNASKIISAPITGPKLKIEAEVIHAAEVSVPTFVGMKKESKKVVAYDTVTGQIVNDVALVNYPEMKMEKQVMNIKHPHELTIDLKTGDKIENTQEKKVHGIDNNSEEKKKEDKQK